jgi:hypothetical protein
MNNKRKMKKKKKIVGGEVWMVIQRRGKVNRVMHRSNTR